jgi:hypothetical protein
MWKLFRILRINASLNPGDDVNPVIYAQQQLLHFETAPYVLMKTLVVVRVLPCLTSVREGLIILNSWEKTRCFDSLPIVKKSQQ